MARRRASKSWAWEGSAGIKGFDGCVLEKGNAPVKRAESVRNHYTIYMTADINFLPLMLVQ